MPLTGAIEHAPIERLSVEIIMSKLDARRRFSISFTRFYALFINNSYPLPRMEKCIDSLCDAKSYSTLISTGVLADPHLR